MSKELITNILCDNHGDERVDGAQTIPPITLPNGKQKVVDLCIPCFHVITYKNLVDLAIEVGETVEDSRQSRVQMDKTPTIPCRIDGCGRMFGSNQGRVMHERRSHPDEYEALVEADLDADEEPEPEGDMFTCADCDRVFSTKSGLGRHRTSAHPERILQTAI